MSAPFLANSNQSRLATIVKVGFEAHVSSQSHFLKQLAGPRQNGQLIFLAIAFNSLVQSGRGHLQRQITLHSMLNFGGKRCAICVLRAMFSSIRFNWEMPSAQAMSLMR